MANSTFPKAGPGRGLSRLVNICYRRLPLRGEGEQGLVHHARGSAGGDRRRRRHVRLRAADPHRPQRAALHVRGQADGEGEKYAQFIVNTLKPYIDANYRTLNDRLNTAIGGSSLGGLISYYTALQYDTVFSKALIFSPSFWFDDSVNIFTENYEKILLHLLDYDWLFNKSAKSYLSF